MILGRNKPLMMAALFAAVAGSNFGSMTSPMPAANFTSPGFRRGRNAGKPQPAAPKLVTADDVTDVMRHSFIEHSPYIMTGLSLNSEINKAIAAAVNAYNSLEASK
jgi:hypothetical protein